MFIKPAETLRFSVLAVVCAATLSGCASAKRDWEVRRALNAPLDPDIVKIYSFYANNPFMSFDAEGDPNPEGFKISAFYAVSGKTKKGAYADGLIRFKMYRVRREPGEQPVGELVHTWEFTPEEAAGWRVTRQTYMGWPYQFHLFWGDLDLFGSEIRIVPEFVRLDGQIVRGSTRSFKVPARKDRVKLIDSTAAN